MSIFFVLKHVVRIFMHNFNVFDNPSMFLYVLMMFCNSRRLIKTDRKMSEVLQIVRKNNFSIIAFVSFIVWIKRSCVCVCVCVCVCIYVNKKVIYIYIYIYIYTTVFKEIIKRQTWRHMGHWWWKWHHTAL
jgi:hypothetical protein